MAKEIKAIDINLHVAESTGTAYYRIPPHFRDFMNKCLEKHEIIGFAYEYGELNFGVILKDK